MSGPQNHSRAAHGPIRPSKGDFLNECGIYTLFCPIQGFLRVFSLFDHLPELAGVGSRGGSGVLDRRGALQSPQEPENALFEGFSIQKIGKNRHQTNFCVRLEQNLSMQSVCNFFSAFFNPIPRRRFFCLSKNALDFALAYHWYKIRPNVQKSRRPIYF